MKASQLLKTNINKAFYTKIIKDILTFCVQDVHFLCTGQEFESKSKRSIPVPLNKQAITILKAQIGKNPRFVFIYNGNPVTRCNNYAWIKALKRAGINDFRWHDLRHTWASWHVQNGTPWHELQQLGGWSNYEMVLRYAHLTSEHLRTAAERVHEVCLTE